MVEVAVNAARIAAVRILSLFFVLVALSACTTQSVMQSAVTPLSSEKYAAIVVDTNNGRVLFQENARDLRYPASLTKMMTLYMLFEAMDEGRIGPQDEIPVSAYAAKRPPSKIGLKAGQSIDVRTAILALSVRSANDVAAAIGEHLGGSEDRFAAMMTAKARSLGMQSTVFRNASGLPDEGQRTTAYDMAILAMSLRKRFPHHYHYFGNREFSYAGKVIRGHNNLLGRVAGVDGLKTGYIRASGFNLATSVGRGGRRIVAIVMGGESAKARDAHMEELIEYYLPRASLAGA
ncbi:D-alanyl-D-alanine carboxypeptidase family protein [Aquamicrobium zhengzhouense]|uniref:D-alanyl-D-alanine carboxypeptidase n=1 Tax=Aquamicrobium zhengzhouense TaxID=2781738 RepID=A0ABS0SHK1_9HYPH|nr:D-alanyl-D-alanine carboxypeptidase family protein [Aquamicrobium zhengzhouense]MBI1622784.1 D-alanyl-D-alanine carboxypeptidase [Aquamicrobium zhengzhouense]